MYKKLRQLPEASDLDLIVVTGNSSEFELSSSSAQDSAPSGEDRPERCLVDRALACEIIFTMFSGRSTGSHREAISEPIAQARGAR